MAKILIVDDERLNIDVLVHILDHEHQVLVAKSGEQALRRIAGSHPDLVLLDVMMPGMDGYEVCRRMKADPTTAGIPVVFVTAMGDEKDEAYGFALGAVDYITKPVSPPVVQARVRTQLELKSQRDRLQALHQRAERLAAARSDFLAMMSHEIRTPMNGVLGTLELLSTTQLNNEQAGLVDVCMDSARLLLTIIDDILDYSKIEANKLEIEARPFALHKTIGNVRTLLSARAEARGLEFTTTIDPSLPRHLVGDELRIRQVILNLLSNAIKFTERGRVTLTVTAGATPVARGAASDEGTRIPLRFAVEDTGIGLTDEQRGRLFQPFEQVQAGAARRFGGTGLGLAICRRLVELMGGAIRVESQPGCGSVFWFDLTLPLPESVATVPEESTAQAIRSPGVMAAPGGQAIMIAPTPEMGPLAEAGSASARTRTVTGAVTGAGWGRVSQTAGFRDRGGAVLVAEDTPTSRMVITMMLQRLGVEVEAVDNGHAALEALARRRFDLLLTDCHMPDLDGFQLCARIRERENPGAPRLAVVALTASVLKEEVERCHAVGMDDVLTKPVDLERIKHTLNRWLPCHPAPGRPQPATEPKKDAAATVMPTAPAAPAAGRPPGGDPSIAPALDIGLYRDLLGGITDDVRTILCNYLIDATQLYHQARSTIGMDSLAARAAIHRLGGASSSAGARELAELCRSIEGALTGGDHDAALARLDELGPALERLRGAIGGLPPGPGLPPPTALPAGPAL